MNDVISILCPTRSRLGPMVCTMRLLRHLAARPERLEILLGVDVDDPIDYVEAWGRFAPKGQFTGGTIVKSARHGYEGLFHYYNSLARRATGRWCLLWNDDGYMATKDWDLVLDGVPGEFVVAMTESNHGRSPCTFPIFTKALVDTLGHVSLAAHNDTWLEEVGKAAGITVDVPITVLHAYLDDEVAKTGKARINETSAIFYSEEMKALRQKDVTALQTAMSRPQAP